MLLPSMYQYIYNTGTIEAQIDFPIEVEYCNDFNACKI